VCEVILGVSVKEGETVKVRILRLLVSGEKRYTELMRALAKPDYTVYTNLKELQRMDLVSKVGRGSYAITKKGKNRFRSLVARKQIDNDLFLESGKSHLKTLEEAERRLKGYGVALDLQKSRGTLEFLGSLGLLGAKDLLRGFKFLDDPAKRYVRSLAKIYVNSPERFLGKRAKDLSFPDLKTIWRLVRPDAWRVPDEREGLIFNYLKCWKEFKMELDRDEELMNRMKERGIDQRKVFLTLRLFSLPIVERVRLVKKDIERIASPDEKRKGGEKS